jgi:hypothetical protein
MKRIETRRTLAQQSVLTLALLFGVAPAAHGAVEVTAAAAATVQTKGPRPGDSGKLYLNVEGKNNGDASVYASFAVLDFRPAKPAAPAAKVKEIKLVLVQSLARFSKDGKFNVFLTTDDSTSIEPGSSPLKFEPGVSGGVGNQLKMLQTLGETAFKKGATGDVDTVALRPSDEAEALLRARLNAGAVIRLVLVPADDDVAATYFGTGHEKPESRPRLLLDAAQ